VIVGAEASAATSLTSRHESTPFAVSCVAVLSRCIDGTRRGRAELKHKPTGVDASHKEPSDLEIQLQPPEAAPEALAEMVMVELHRQEIVPFQTNSAL